MPPVPLGAAEEVADAGRLRDADQGDGATGGGIDEGAAPADEQSLGELGSDQGGKRSSRPAAPAGSVAPPGCCEQR